MTRFKTGISRMIREMAFSAVSRSASFRSPKRFSSCGSRLKDLITRIPIRSSCTMALIRSTFFCISEKIGIAFRIIKTIIMATTGIATAKINASCAFTVTDIISANSIINGARIAMRRLIIVTMPSMSISVVKRVIRDGTLIASILAKEKRCTLR